ncbi:class I SAM-dependent methyltransferase [Kribbella jiaozuonensis]|uniref:Class I SAM-dependent methyltransferase n=1 Tax=Kribbella jiaozuonensis TaxID=2575441 RepID=A0A4U3LVU5_9ACTN|nr:class I SAM-dependent methyltransferase [Kribbella jiaozuonensis]TKK80265.1 class I SAM-dependent methyltransferase [Kribbella jiaozuonensis]
MFDYDAEMRFYRPRFREACGVRDGDRVLDVGCGGGQTTRDAAADAAHVLGVDVSERMLEHARRQPLPNVDYLLADAATYAFEPSFDLCISRFGVMFFDDLVGAFTNLRRALRPGGRLVVLVWQPRAENEWARVIPEVIGGTYRDESAFALGSEDVTRDILTSAGFVDPTFTAVHELLYYGPDAETAYANVLRLREPQALLAELDAAAAERAQTALREMLAAHQTGSGVHFESSAWIVTGVT